MGEVRPAARPGRSEEVSESSQAGKRDETLPSSELQGKARAILAELERLARVHEDAALAHKAISEDFFAVIADCERLKTLREHLQADVERLLTLRDEAGQAIAAQTLAAQHGRESE